MAAYQYIYVMKGLGKIYPGGREVLQRHLAVVFSRRQDRRARPQRRRQIDAAADHGRPGARLLRRGLGRRGRQGRLSVAGAALDPDKDVAGNVMEGLAETKALLDRFEEVSARFAEELSPEEMDALIAEQGELQEKIDQADAWELDRTVEIAMDALRCPPGDAAGRRSCRAASAAASRCAACCCSAPTCCCSTSRPTISTPSRSRGCSAF